jgi:hypothetical protein
MKENEINIEDRISLARRTMYALMNTGLHGTNGMNPLAAIKMYEAYVIPKLLYGVEILPLNATQTALLSKFHIANLRRLQSLPTRTAIGIVYLLVGAMPIEAEIHRRQLSFLHNILSCNNATIQTPLERQLVMNIDNIQSFFCQISKILDLFNIPCIQELIANPPTKLSWKIKCKKAVQNFWTYKLKELIVGKSSLRFVYNKDLKAGSIHKLWTSLYSTVSVKE